MIKKNQMIKYRNYVIPKRNQIVIELLFGFSFLVLAVLSGFKACGLLSCFLFILYISIYTLLHKRLLIKYMFLFFGIIFYFVGNTICNFLKIYLVELNITTYYNGSLAVFVFYQWIYLNLLILFDYKLAPVCYKKTICIKYKITNLISVNNILMKYGRHIVFIIGLILFICVFRTPSFLLNYNRFKYAKNVLPGFLYKVRTIPLLLAPVVVISVLENAQNKSSKGKVISIIFTYLPFMFFALWIGNKFGIFWQLFYSLVIPLSINIDLERMKNTSLIKYSIIGVIGLFLFVIIFFIARGNGLNDILEKLFRRFSAQGEIWWAVFSDNKACGISGFIDEVKDIILSILTRGKIKQYGVYKIMKLYGSPSYVNHYLDIDMRFSAMGFELSYCFFGALSFLIFPLATIPFYVLLVNCYINATSNKNFLEAFALLRMLIVYHTGICQGDWYRFTSGLDILVISLLLFSVLAKGRK